jgi:hypothetical protein
MRKVHLHDQERPPTRVGKLKLEPKFVFHNEGTLFNTHTTIHAAPGVEGGSQPHSGTHSLSGGLVQQPWGQWDSPLTLSAAERAILELLDEVPQLETFHQADILMGKTAGRVPQRQGEATFPVIRRQAQSRMAKAKADSSRGDRFRNRQAHAAA